VADSSLGATQSAGATGIGHHEIKFVSDGYHVLSGLAEVEYSSGKTQSESPARRLNYFFSQQYPIIEPLPEEASVFRLGQWMHPASPRILFLI
jgi:hypothetical protein